MAEPAKNLYTSGPRGYMLRHANDPRPWTPAFAQMHDHTMVQANVPAKVFYYDATSFVDAQIAVQSYYGLDMVTALGDVYNFEAEALGQKMIYGENAMPTIDFREPLIKEPKDLLKLKTPDWTKDGRIPYQTEVHRQCAEMGMLSAFGAMFCAPFSLAVGVRSYPLLMRDLKKDPKFVHDLFTFLEDEVLVPYVKYIHDETGATRFSGADAWAAFPLLSPQTLKDWLVPWNKRLMAKCAEFGVHASSIAGDYNEERPENFNADILKQCLEITVESMGMPALFMGMGRWQDYPLEPVLEYGRELKKKTGGPVLVQAGINARVLRDGPVSKIVYNVKRMIDTFAPEFNVVIFLASTPADAPPEHIHAAVQATHYYGKMPYQFIDDGASFRPAPREPLAEFMAKIDTL